MIVRKNSGESTTDNIIIMLTQPVHADKIPRRRGLGYPQNQKYTLYATNLLSLFATSIQPVMLRYLLMKSKPYSEDNIFGVQTKGNAISTSKIKIIRGSLRI